MPGSALLLLTAALAWSIWRGSYRVALATLLATVVLVPDTLALPGRGLAFLPIGRMLVFLFATRLARDARRGDLWHDDLRLSRVHWAFIAHLSAVFAAGAVLAPRAAPLRPMLGTFPTVIEQMLILVAQLAMFTVALVACRVIGDLRWLVKLFAVVAAISVGIALAEHLTGSSWGYWFLRGGGRTGTLGAYQLNERGGELRVRAGAQFALAFAWVTAMLFPFIVSHALAATRRLWWLVPPVAAMTIVWSGSRSALPALGAAAVVLVVAVRFDRRYVVFTVAAALLGAVFLFGSTSLLFAYSSSEASGSDRTRTDRLAVSAEATAERPITGLGIGAVSTTLGDYGTDASYLQAYIETGVLGLTTLCVLLVTAVLCAGAGLRAPPRTLERRVAAATVTALIIGTVGGGAYDLFSVPGSNFVFWAICGLGVAVADRVRVPAVRMLAPSPWRAAVPVIGVMLGLALAATAPRHGAVTYRFQSVPARWVADSDQDIQSLGDSMANSACGQIDQMAVGPRVSVRCRVVKESGGVGDLRIEAPDAADADAFGAAVVERVHSIQPAFRAERVGSATTGRPTFATTAPLWLGVAGLLFAILLPPPRVGGDALVERRDENDVAVVRA
jgi:hypothetical protein